jgi:hypothetical protein
MAVIEDGTGVVTVGPSSRREHHDARSCGAQRLQRTGEVIARIVIGIVQDDGDEAADAGQIVGAQNRFQLLGVRWEEAVGPELGGG